MAKESKVISNLINVCNEKKTFVIEDAVFTKIYLMIKLFSVVEEFKVIQNVNPDKNTGLPSIKFKAKILHRILSIEMSTTKK